MDLMQKLEAMEKVLGKDDAKVLEIGMDILENNYNELSSEEVLQIMKMAGIGQELWEPFPGPQVEALECQADELFYGGAAGGGKALADDTPILTPFGLRPIGNLAVGDTILAADGTPTKVIGVHPQGVRKLYRVTLQDGASVLADLNHKWNYSIARKGKWRKSGREWKVATTQQLITLMENGSRVLLPTCEPLKFTKSYRYDMRPVDPYALGLLLGDGYTAQTGPGAKWTFASMDFELVSALPGEWVSDGYCGYRLRGAERPVLMDAFDRLGLAGCKAGDKFIPESYKFGTIEQRIAVLQGLMDTDGTVNEGKLYFTSISQQLATDVQWLVRSLGGWATVTDRIPVCSNGACGRVEGARAYTVYIKLPDPSIAFRLQRKKVKVGKAKTLKRRIVSIEYEGIGPATCISVDHPSSLYVAGEGMIVTHNSDLLIGLALTRHQHTIIYRREATQLVGILQRMAQIIGDRKGYNGQDRIWRFDHRLIEFGAVKDPGSEEKYQGRPHDLKGFDEITHFVEFQYNFLNGWKRSADPDQRVRTVATGNPPTRPEGLWVKKYWGPWLDRNNPLYGKLEPGELAYYFRGGDGQMVFLRDPDPQLQDDGEIIIPRSLTFIPSRVEDNPVYMATGYKQQLQSLPEPLRSQMLKGDFEAFSDDNPYQVIPTNWIVAAQKRWEKKETRKAKGEMLGLGVDPARGGMDNTVICKRFEDMWFDELKLYPGGSTPDGATVVSLIVAERKDDAPVMVDVIGIGASVVDIGVMQGLHIIPWNNSEAAPGLITGLKFPNKRSWVYWHFRELLNPENETGIALPPDDDLLAELAAHQFSMTSRGIQVWAKDKVREKIGRSPDRADAVVMSAVETPKRFQRRKDFLGAGDDDVDLTIPDDYNPYWD